MASIQTIGIFAPASAIKEGEELLVKQAITMLEDWGLKVICADNIFEQEELFTGSGSYVPGSVSRRIDSMMKLWASVDVLLALRGGYGCIQLLDQLDYKWMQSNPRPLLGYSDLTALFCGVYTQAYQKLNLQLFHTPMLCDLMKIDRDSLSSFTKLLQAIDIDAYKRGDFRMGTASKIAGGNLSLLAALIGTEYLPSFKDNILFIEDCKEPGYKIQRMLQQLRLARVFEGIKELWLGTALETIYDLELLKDLSKEFNFALITGKPVGHGITNYSLALY